MIVFSHIRNVSNIGDMASCPAQWFSFPEHRIVNFSDPLPEAVDAVIYGGGTMMNWLRAGRFPKTKLVAWGIGSSRHGRKYPWPDPKGFALLGMREYMPEREITGTYVPCASCMSPLFDEEYQIEHEAVLFVNAGANITQRYPVTVGGLPVLENNAPIEQTVRFLASGKTVITNSYHGCYWAALLGREVVCLPYSSKFLWFKFPPAYSRNGGADWRSLPRNTYPSALEDARSINRVFYKRVLSVIG